MRVSPKFKLYVRGYTQKRIAKLAEMDPMTLHRRLKNPQTFTIAEFGRICAVMHESPFKFLEIDENE